MYLTLWLIGTVTGLTFVALAVRTLLIIRRYAPPIRRIFEETPIFSPTEGVPHPASEEVEFTTRDDVTLRGSYLRAAGDPRGLVVFCHEFLSDRWSGIAYWEFLREAGFDIFAFDFRNHGASEHDPGFTPRHWVTGFELADLEAAIDHLKTRPGSSRLAIGLFGVSRGGGAAIGVAARDRNVRCVVTDGAFPTHHTVLVYMKKWMALYVTDHWFYKVLPDWYIAFVRDRVLARVERDFGCWFIRLERAIRRIAPRPILMIYGGRDSYIRPDIAREFFECAREPRELWIVHGARHNACLETAGGEYRSRVLEFFQRNLADVSARPGQRGTANRAAAGDCG